jgi:hypothetical protein
MWNSQKLEQAICLISAMKRCFTNERRAALTALNGKLELWESTLALLGLMMKIAVFWD